VGGITDCLDEVYLEVSSMIRCVLTGSLGLALLAAGVGHSADDIDPVLAPEKADLALVVNLRVPNEEKFAKVHEILDKVKAQGATHLTLRALRDGAGASAEVVAQSKTPSKRVAAVVGELLDGGIKKIFVEVKE
jgi:hypothetical protein